MIDLVDFLEGNCLYLEEAIQHVPARGDLPPILVGFKDEQPIACRPVGTRAMTMAIFRTALRKYEADNYVVIWPAWYVPVRRKEHAEAFAVIDRHGSEHPQYRDRRVECYQVVVGDRERTLTAVFNVERDYKGKIRRLVRLEGDIGQLFGRAINLLVDEVVH